MGKPLTIVLNFFIILVVSSFLALGADMDLPHHFIESLEHNSVNYEFSNLRFTQREGQLAISVDVAAFVATSFRSRDLPLSQLNLVMYHNVMDTMKEIEVSPRFFNSFSFGRILLLDPDGERADSETFPQNVKSIREDSGNTHRGSLLYFLPDSFSFIHKFSIQRSEAVLRQTQNVYVDITAFSPETIFDILCEVVLPAEGHFNLMDIYLAMMRFIEVNDSVKDSW